MTDFETRLLIQMSKVEVLLIEVRDLLKRSTFTVIGGGSTHPERGLDRTFGERQPDGEITGLVPAVPRDTRQYLTSPTKPRVVSDAPRDPTRDEPWRR